MFAKTQLGNMSFAFPDVCNVVSPAGPIPTPMPNIAMSSTSIPNVPNIFVGGGPAHNLLTPGTISSGDEAGAAMGVASGTVIGPERNLLGSFAVFMGTAPAARMTGMTMQNSTNMVGATLTPSQVNVMTLS